MKKVANVLAGIVAIVGLLPGSGACFDSGSTGADGDFNPSVSTEVPLPPNGVLNYRSVNIPAGVTVRFKRNATNTPVIMLVAGDVVIAGTMNLAGEAALPTGPVGGNDDFLDDGLPGKGAPGGFDGGHGGVPAGSESKGGRGLGPGGGGGGTGNYAGSGGGAGHATAGGRGHVFGSPGEAGSTYGSKYLLPLIGGSGGGGGYTGPSYRGCGGGGGGGAILLAATGKVTISGLVTANGGAGGAGVASGYAWLGTGGGGSGGAIRIVATQIVGTGEISAAGGPQGTGGAGYGGAGWVRLESDAIAFSGSVNPPFTFAAPGPLFMASQPAVRFASVAGIPVPGEPTGSNDLTIPTTTANPVTLALATSGIPPGSVIKVTVIPRFGPAVSLDSPPTAGTVAAATTSVSMDIPGGHNVLSAETTYTVIASVGDSLSRFAEGERVEKITFSSTLGKGSQATLHTPSGRQFPIEPALLALAALPY